MVIGERARAEGRRHRGRACRIAIDHRDQIRLGQGGVLLGMEPAEMPDADDRSAQSPHRR